MTLTLRQFHIIPYYTIVLYGNFTVIEFCFYFGSFAIHLISIYWLTKRQGKMMSFECVDKAFVAIKHFEMKKKAKIKAAAISSNELNGGLIVIQKSTQLMEAQLVRTAAKCV